MTQNKSDLLLSPWKTQRYECARHGDIGEEVIRFRLIEIEPHENSIYCLRCWSEALKAAGVCQVKPIPEL